MYAQLLKEVRELKQRVEKLEEKVYKGQKQTRKGVGHINGIKPPWEREGISKKEWLGRRNKDK